MKPAKDYAPLLFLFLLNVIIKSLYLSVGSLSHDEPFTVYHAQFDIAELITYLKQYNNPPLFELILHPWIRVFGISELSVRTLPMLFSSLSVVFIYLIGRDFFNRHIAWLASLLYSFSTMQIWYAHDSRVYSLFLLLTLVSFYLFFKLLREEKTPVVLILILTVSNVLLVYAHYFGFFVWLLEAIIILLFHFRNRRLLLIFSLIMLSALLLYLPHILSLYERFSDSATKGTWLAPPSGIESLYNMIWSFSNAPFTAVLSIFLLVAALFRSFYLPGRQDSLRMPFCIAIWFLFPLLFMFLISYRIPMFLDRYLIYITPAFYMLLALSLSVLLPRKPWFYASSAVLLLSFILTCSFNPSKKRAVRETVDYIRSHKDANTLVLICPSEFMTTFAYYYRQDYFRQVKADSEYGTLSSLLMHDHILCVEQLSPELLHKAASFHRIIYLDAGADFSLPGNHIKEDLLTHYQLKEEQFRPDIFHIYVLENTAVVKQAIAGEASLAGAQNNYVLMSRPENL